MINPDNSGPIMSNEVAYAIPYKQIIADLTNDSVYLSHDVLKPLIGTITPTKFITLVRKTIDLWLEDTLIKPLEDMVTKSHSTQKSEELYQNLTDNHEIDMDIYEYILAYPGFAKFKKVIEDSIQSAYDIWSVEKTERYIYVKYVNDFRICYFNRNVQDIPVNEYLEIKG